MSKNADLLPTSTWDFFGYEKRQGTVTGFGREIRSETAWKLLSILYSTMWRAAGCIALPPACPSAVATTARVVLARPQIRGRRCGRCFPWDANWAKFIGGLLRQSPRGTGAYVQAMAAGGANTGRNCVVEGPPRLLDTEHNAVLLAGLQVACGH